MTFEEYLVLLPAPPSPLVEASMREGWIACMRQRDAEKEIARRDARIAELEQDLQTTADALGHAVAQTEEGYPGIAHDFEQAKLTITQQSAEITRLKAVIAKCKETLGSSISDLQEPNFVTLASWRVREALAAIKEEGL